MNLRLNTQPRNQVSSVRNYLPIRLRFVLAIVALAVAAVQASAAPTDIVPLGSDLIDAFSRLSTHGYLSPGQSASDFLSGQLYTRAELARIVEQSVLNDPKSLTRAESDRDCYTALQAIVRDLRPELKADGVDTSAVTHTGGPTGAIPVLEVQPEGRIRVGGDQKPDSGSIGIYRGTELGQPSRDFRYVASVSNWPQDYREVFDNDNGAHDFSALNELYGEVEGKNGFVFDFGRMFQRWGPGYSGSTLISDNSPAFNQLNIAFPFSLGRHLGRQWQYTQFAATFEEDGTQKYVQGRRIEIIFSKRWNGDFEEALKSVGTNSLVAIPFPFLIGKGLALSSLEKHTNYVGNFGLNYTPNDYSRAYGQFMIDDLKTPLHGNFLGFELNKGGNTPRKIAYLVGASADTEGGTGITAEYSFVDPTTYTYNDTDAEWQQGAYDQIGLPSGPNAKEFYGRLSQRISHQVSLAIYARDRLRDTSSFPEPDAHDFAGQGIYRFNTKSSVLVTIHDYRQDPYPFVPGQPGYPPANTLAPLSEGNPGQLLRIKQLDIAYQLAF